MVYALEVQEKLKSLYFLSKRIRQIEEFIAEQYREQRMRCPTHLSIGQELAGAAIGLSTNTSDYAISTHRSHAHFLGKGGDLMGMIAELHGKQEGCSKGRGGSMHLIDRDVGFEASTAIVGNSIPVAIGLSKAIKLSGKTSICVVFVGDAVFETGVFYESINLAATWELPILFICENNLYSVYSPFSVRQPKNRENFKIAQEMGLQASLVDGMDALSTLTACEKAVNYVRNKTKPYLIEMSAYRWREHCGPNFDNDIGYRSEKEYQEWKSKDYLSSLEANLLQCNAINPQLIQAHTEEVISELQKAFTKAISAKPPQASEYLKLEYGV